MLGNELSVHLECQEKAILGHQPMNLQKEDRFPRENPRMHEEKTKTPHRKDPAEIEIWAF